MKHNIFSTFDPTTFKDNRYRLLFDYLSSHGLNVRTNSINLISDLEYMIFDFMENGSSYDFVFHIPECINHNLFKNQNDCLLENELGFSLIDIQENLNETLKDFANEKAIFDADIFLHSEKDVFRLYDLLDIPYIKKKTIPEFENNLHFPVVLKKNRTSKGRGIFFIENQEQYEKLFEAIDNNSNKLFRKNDFKASDFIKTPSDYYTYYRVYTTGDGNILASGMSYSDFQKQDELFELDYNSIIDNPNSKYFIKRKRIEKRDNPNRLAIPLNPNESSRDIIDLENEILNEHGISNQKLPKPIFENSKKIAKLLGKNGIYVLGQDWIQSDDGNFYCVEVNKFPGFAAIKTSYYKYLQKHNIDEKVYATKLIGDNIIKQLGD